MFNKNAVLKLVQNQKKVYYYLLLLNIIISLSIFITQINRYSGDYHSYLYYVNGLHEGKYSFWYFLKEYNTDTFRNPGYPFFLYGLSLVFKSEYFYKGIQFLLIWTSILIIIKLLLNITKSYIAINIFLFLLCVNCVIFIYAPLIYPEALMIFLASLIIYIEMLFDNLKKRKYILLILLYSIMFQVRPAILFIPFMRLFYNLIKYRFQFLLKDITLITFFILSMIPYGLWNKKNHNIFKITPLEGGAGAMYLGYWSPKMVGHVESKLWRNVMYKDVLINFSDEISSENNVKLFNSEMDSVLNICSAYLTDKDKRLLDTMKKNNHLFPTFSAGYTIKREEMLKELSVQHYLNDWKYTVKLKFFSFFRLWYSGLDSNKIVQFPNFDFFLESSSFISTFATLLLFIGYFLFTFFYNRKILLILILPLIWCLYFDIIHLPFVLQSRYTIPVRLLYLLSLSFMIYQTHFKTKENESH